MFAYKNLIFASGNTNCLIIMKPDLKQRTMYGHGVKSDAFLQFYTITCSKGYHGLYLWYFVDFG